MQRAAKPETGIRFWFSPFHHSAPLSAAKPPPGALEPPAHRPGCRSLSQLLRNGVGHRSTSLGCLSRRRFPGLFLYYSDRRNRHPALRAFIDCLLDRDN
jgi:hypothetical protein